MKLKAVPSAIGSLPSSLGYAPDQRFTPNRAKLYGRRWRGERVKFLAEHRYCVFCQARGERTRATVADHTFPHKGNYRVFWDQSKWQPLCAHDHDATKQAIENKAGDDHDLLEQLNQQARTAPGVPRA